MLSFLEFLPTLEWIWRFLAVSDFCCIIRLDEIRLERALNQKQCRLFINGDYRKIKTIFGIQENSGISVRPINNANILEQNRGIIICRSRELLRFCCKLNKTQIAHLQ